MAELKTPAGKRPATKASRSAAASPASSRTRRVEALVDGRRVGEFDVGVAGETAAAPAATPPAPPLRTPQQQAEDFQASIVGSVKEAAPPASVASREQPLVSVPPAQMEAPDSMAWMKEAARSFKGRSVTDAALASIVAVRRPIRPEFAPGGLVALIPALVIVAVLVMLVIGLAAAASPELFGPFGPLSDFNVFGQARPSTPPNAFFPGYPYRRQ